MDDNKILTDPEIRGVIQDTFSDHSLIDDFLDHFHWYDMTQQDVINYYTDYMATCGEY